MCSVLYFWYVDASFESQAQSCQFFTELLCKMNADSIPPLVLRAGLHQERESAYGSVTLWASEVLFWDPLGLLTRESPTSQPSQVSF